MPDPIKFFVARPPVGNGHAKITEGRSWHGQLALSEDCIEQYLEAVAVRDSYDLDAAASFLEANGWKVIWSFIGVHGD
jgi:hypothetical protein